MFNKVNQRGHVSWYEDADDFYESNNIDECLLPWEEITSDWEDKPSIEDVQNGFVTFEKDGKTHVTWNLDRPSLNKFIFKINQL